MLTIGLFPLYFVIVPVLSSNSNSSSLTGLISPPIFEEVSSYSVSLFSLAFSSYNHVVFIAKAPAPANTFVLIKEPS